MNASNAASISPSGSVAIADIIGSNACGISTIVLYIVIIMDYIGGRIYVSVL